MKKTIWMTAGAMLTISGTVMADTDQNMVFGIGLGQSEFKLNESAVGISGDASQFAGKIFAGYSFNRYVNVELAYIYGGSVEKRIEPDILVDGSSRAIQASVIGFLPIWRSMSLSGRAALNYWDAHATYTDTFTHIRGDDDGTDPSFAVGLVWSNETAEFPVQLRIEYEKAEFDWLDFELITIGAAWRF